MPLVRTGETTVVRGAQRVPREGERRCARVLTRRDGQRSDIKSNSRSFAAMQIAPHMEGRGVREPDLRAQYKKLVIDLHGGDERS